MPACRLLPVDDEEAVKQCIDIGCSVREMPYEFLVDRVRELKCVL